MTRLEGKVTVITGGAGGIGRATAKRFVAEGAHVLLVDLEEAALARVRADIGSERVGFVVGDVTSAEDNVAMIEAAKERFGGVDS